MRELPRAIVFDLDDTLLKAYVRPDLAWGKVTRELAPLLGSLAPEAAAARIQARAGEYWAEPGDHRERRLRLRESRREVVSQAFAALRREGHAIAEGADLRIADRFSDLRDEEMCLHAGACETLDALRARGVRLGLLTNGAGEQQRAKLARFDLTRFFDHVQIEGEHEFGKPEERAYRHALASLSVTPTEVWIVGDNLEWEVAAPQRLGIHAIWFDGEGQGLPAGTRVTPDRTIRSLLELLPGS